MYLNIRQNWFECFSSMHLLLRHSNRLQLLAHPNSPHISFSWAVDPFWVHLSWLYVFVRISGTRVFSSRHVLSHPFYRTFSHNFRIRSETVFQCNESKVYVSRNVCPSWTHTYVNVVLVQILEFFFIKNH